MWENFREAKSKKVQIVAESANHSEHANIWQIFTVAQNTPKVLEGYRASALCSVVKTTGKFFTTDNTDTGFARHG